MNALSCTHSALAEREALAHSVRQYEIMNVRVYQRLFRVIMLHSCEVHALCTAGTSTSSLPFLLWLWLRLWLWLCGKWTRGRSLISVKFRLVLSRSYMYASCTVTMESV
jgi:hypothetical protein